MNWLDIIRVPDSVSAACDAGRRSLSLRDSLWRGGDVDVETKVYDGEVSVSVSSEKTALSYVYLRWNLNIPENLRILGDHWERGYGDLEWRGIVPERALPWYFMSFDGLNTNGCGVRTGAAAFCLWTLDQWGVTLRIDTRNGGCGVILGGRKLHAADIIVHVGAEGETPFKTACVFCHKLCLSPRLPPLPVYGSNNWYYSYGKSSSSEILEIVEVLSGLTSGLKNRPHMLIDAGWQARALEDGHACGAPWDRGNSKFADMAGLAADIQKYDVSPGIWIRPLAASPNDDKRLLLPSSRMHGGRKDDLALDPSLPDVQERVRNDFRRLRDWGYKIIKHDFTTYDILGRWGFEMNGEMSNAGWNFSDKSKTTAEIILELYRHMRDGADDSLIIGCNSINHLSAGNFEIQRTGDDTSGLKWETTRKMGVNTLAFRLPQHNAFFAADADCAGLTEKVPWHLNRQWIEILAKSGTPFFVSFAPKTLTGEQKETLKQAFKTASQKQSYAEPLDWMETTSPKKWMFGGDIKEFNWRDENGGNDQCFYA